MSAHLQILREKFPGKILLEVEDIAECMNVSSGHIHNLKSQKRLKFSLFENEMTNRIQVSIVEFAKYLDSKIENKKIEPIVEPSIPSLIVKKKGRPRGATRKLMAFQHQLSLSIIEYEFNQNYCKLEKIVDELEFFDDGKQCSDKFESAKDKVATKLMDYKRAIDYTMMIEKVPQVQYSEPKKAKGKV